MPMLYGMPAPASDPTPTREQGFILIEVLVSALILAIVAGAVLALITATTRSAASERYHSYAYALAQEDQARLRTQRISSLNNLSQTRTEKANGASFTIESRGVFVNNTTGTSSCTAQNSSADYILITSTVTSSALPNAVSLQSAVSPSSGSLDPSHGTLTFQVNNAAEQPVSGVSISGSGGRNFSGASEENGCAVFADLPAGNYSVTSSAGSLVNPAGNTSATKEIRVEASSTQQVVLHYDTAGKIRASFVYLEPSTKALVAAPVDSMEVYNSEGEGTAEPSYPLNGAPGGTRAASIEDASVYPFKGKYAVYGGSCESNNPGSGAAVASVAVTGGSTATPQIQLPALNLTVTNGTTALKGAKVVVTDQSCAYNSSQVKRAFETNEIGHISATTSGKTESVGLPYGTYTVCAIAKLTSTEWRKIEATGYEVKSLTTPLAAKSLNVKGTGSTSSSSEPKCS